jgi:hypothetical protein
MSLDVIQKARSMASKAIIVALGTSLCVRIALPQDGVLTKHLDAVG